MELEELQRSTVVKLREEALQQGGIAGVNGMSKDQLIEALAPVFGIDLEAETRALRERLSASKGSIKQEIITLKSDRDSALANHDRDGFISARKEIKQRKRRIRQLMKAAKV